MGRLGIAVVLLMVASVSAAFADAVSIGLLSFDRLIPGAPGSPGVNGFTIANLTGDPAFDGFALTPDFPVSTRVVFLSSTLTLETGSTPQVFNLGVIAPGFFSSPALQFADTILFSSATFSATLSLVNFDLLGTPGVFQVDSPTITVDLRPSSGGELVPGTDLAVLNASGTVAAAPVPEPGFFGLLMILLLALLPLRKRLKAWRI
jgi:hypothetical protein